MFWFPEEMGAFSAALFIMGCLLGGMGVIGQPHIVIRFMAQDYASKTAKMQWYYDG